MKITTQTVEISKIKLNPDNPRKISKKNMERLVKSLQDFPDMMKLREIVVDETMTVLGGNMRLLALKKMGFKEVVAKIVKGLTPEQKVEFVIKDNASFGEWDMDILSGLDNLPLVDWGVDIPLSWLDHKESDDAGKSVLQDLKYQVVIECSSEAEQKEFLERFEKEGLTCHALIL